MTSRITLRPRWGALDILQTRMGTTMCVTNLRRHAWLFMLSWFVAQALFG